MSEELPGCGRIIATRLGEATVFAFPPRALGPWGLFLLALGVLFLLAGVFLISSLWGMGKLFGTPFFFRAATSGWFVSLMLICWLNGGGLVLTALLHTSRRATLIVREGGLRIVERSILREKVREWRPGEVTDVVAEGTTLRIGIAGWVPFTWEGIPTVSAAVREAETAWLAARLREALEIKEGHP